MLFLKISSNIYCSCFNIYVAITLFILGIIIITLKWALNFALVFAGRF